jgi:hypothetical protein
LPTGCGCILVEFIGETRHSTGRPISASRSKTNPVAAPSFCCATLMEVAEGRGMNNVIRFPGQKREAFAVQKREACIICEEWPSSRREHLFVEDMPMDEAVCDDCLLAFWEDLMATTPSQREQRLARR